MRKVGLMTESTPLAIEMPESQTPAAYDRPMPTQVSTEPDFQAVIGDVLLAPNSPTEAVVKQQPSRVPEMASLALPAPPVELRQYAQIASEFLQALHLQGRLVPLLEQASRERRMLQEAASAGLTIAPDELQSAADDFRVQRGLRSAEDMAAWLQHEYLTVSQFETAIERTLLMAKLGAGNASGNLVDGQHPARLGAWFSREADYEAIDPDLQILI